MRRKCQNYGCKILEEKIWVRYSKPSRPKRLVAWVLRENLAAQGGSRLCATPASRAEAGARFIWRCVVLLRCCWKEIVMQVICRGNDRCLPQKKRTTSIPSGSNRRIVLCFWLLLLLLLCLLTLGMTRGGARLTVCAASLRGHAGVAGDCCAGVCLVLCVLDSPPTDRSIIPLL